MEMESFEEGVLSKIFVQDGQKVAVGQEIALLLEPGEKEGAAQALPAQPAAKAAAPAGKGRDEPAQRHGPPAAAVPTPGAEGSRLKASPLARKIAAERGVDLTRLAGTGPGGRITQADVLALQPTAATPGAAPAVPVQPPLIPAATAVAPMPATPAGAEDRRVALSGMRRVIAERLLQSKTTIPHFYLNLEADAEPLMKLRAEINASAEATGVGKVTVNDLILKAVTAALVRVPKVNASFAGDAVIEYAAIHLEVAVAVEEGLVTPVIRDAGRLTLRQISEAVKDLANRARGKKLKPEEYQGGTFTVSNLGAYGIESFSAIINPPQAAILSVGAIVKKPVVNAAGQVVAGQRISLGLSCDHRVVDGAIGAQYLGELRKLVENPTLMLL